MLVLVGLNYTNLKLRTTVAYLAHVSISIQIDHVVSKIFVGTSERKVAEERRSS